MSPAGSLLEVVQGLLERTYGMSSGVAEIGRFVIGDSGYRSLYTEPPACSVAGSVSESGARTLVRETSEGVRACIYYPDALIDCLEAHPPQHGLREENVDAFATLVEEADHLLCIAERSRQDRPVTLFELELHANVSKHLVLSRFLSARGRSLGARERAWLGWHLFHKGTPCDPDPAVRARYADAARWALRMLEGTSKLRPWRRLEALRAFHARAASGKLELIRELAQPA